tara:strand:- start:917 stop:1120 length:204 start_codon:yes stop_codon:yes gene_type:complete
MKMGEENKYERVPNVQLPQVKQQLEERIKALENVITTQRTSIEEVLMPIIEQLEEAKEDMKFIENRM